MNSPGACSYETPVKAVHALRVRELNDAFRTTFRGGRVMLTAGIANLPEVTRTALLIAVQSFDRFDADNDPHREHDFGAVEVSGVRVFWKVDPFDLSLNAHSPDPSDPEVTARVLTIMLASEY